MPSPSSPSAQPIIVQKFGGSSVADPEKIKHVASIIRTAHDAGHRVVAVVSAMGKTTDGLVALAKEVTSNPSGREYDMLLSTGEMVSASLMAMCLQQQGYKAIALNGQQAGIVTEDMYNRARILDIDTSYLQQLLNDDYIVIVTGFQGVNKHNEFITLGRGGSDTSAVAVAGALKAERCDIYTDVPGVFSTDPRVAPNAQKMDEIAYVEMLELARLGAKVLHPRSVEAARRWDVKVCVRSTFLLEDKGTLVVDEAQLLNLTDRAIAGVACDKSQARVAVCGIPDEPGSAARIFQRLAQEGISVDMIIQAMGSEPNTNDIVFTVNTWDLQNADTLLTRLKTDFGAKRIELDADVAKVSIVGVGMIDRPGIAADMFSAMGKANINMKMISTSEIKISVLVDKAQADDAVRAIHDSFFIDEEQRHLVDTKLGY
ncbi:MAG: aspartate kinase [Vampirovibrionales bacterium]